MARRRSSSIMSLGFNQDQGCFTCCLKSGLRIYNVEPLVEKTHYSREDIGEVAICEMVYRTNWLLLVKPRQSCSLLLLDDEERTIKAEVIFKTPIRALKARKDKVAVSLDSSVQVLSIPSLTRIVLVRTPLGTRPLCALASDPLSPHLLAAPAHRKGSVQLLDVTRSMKGAHSTSPAVISCHNHELVCLSMSANGARLATASEHGTIIRVWDTASKTKLQELRRGSDYADIYCINFNPRGSLLCCMSDKGTLHMWAARRGPYTYVAAARSTPEVRAHCGFINRNTAVLICEDGSFHKFTFAGVGNCHMSYFDLFLQVGEDDEFIH